MRGFIDGGKEGLYLNARASGRGRGTVGVELVQPAYGQLKPRAAIDPVSSPASGLTNSVHISL